MARHGMRRRYTGDSRLSAGQAQSLNRSFDRSFRTGWRSDAFSVVVAATTLAIGYGFSARAIARENLPVGYVVLPWIVEYLFILWLGAVLCRTWVKEPIFQALSRSLWVPLGWTCALLLPFIVVLGWDNGFYARQLPAGFSTAWQRLRDSGMIWACLAVATALLIDTARDVAAWRRKGGAFVWPATHRFSFRFVALLALIFIAPFAIWAIAAVSSLWGRDPVYSGLAPAWIAYGMLLAADILVLALGTWLHRRTLGDKRRAPVPQMLRGTGS